jgi:NAD-dependent protein deacetylase/lipoamidase
MPSPAERVARLIVENQPCVALTGAGVSTESGIPDFRSPTGMWADFDPLEYATVKAFNEDPVKVWRFYAPRFSMLTKAEPNAAHRALAELELYGLLRAVITQNIDLLHERAGSRDVIEVHGSIRTSTCLDCGARYALDDLLRLLEEGHGAPRCVGCGAVIRPDVVFFDELLPEAAIDRAHELARAARLLLVVGSSLEVWPVAELPLVTLDTGGKVAVVNEGPTSVDARAQLKLGGKAGDLLHEVVTLLRPPRAPVAVVDYDPEWPERFAEESERIRAALGDNCVEIHHIGSTAVPGLAAKPVIDISVGLRDLDLSDDKVASMMDLGYEFLGDFGLPGRLFFRKGGARSTHHVHAVVLGGENWSRHLAFRDYLRSHPDEARLYGEQKRRLAADVDHDWYAYVERKNAFADELFKRAWKWHESRLG